MEIAKKVTALSRNLGPIIKTNALILKPIYLKLYLI
jgi:hypothetical protein